MRRTIRQRGETRSWRNSFTRIPQIARKLILGIMPLVHLGFPFLHIIPRIPSAYHWDTRFKIFGDFSSNSNIHVNITRNEIPAHQSMYDNVPVLPYAFIFVTASFLSLAPRKQYHIAQGNAHLAAFGQSSVTMRHPRSLVRILPTPPPSFPPGKFCVVKYNIREIAEYITIVRNEIYACFGTRYTRTLIHAYLNMRSHVCLLSYRVIPLPLLIRHMSNLIIGIVDIAHRKNKGGNEALRKIQSRRDDSRESHIALAHVHRMLNSKSVSVMDSLRSALKMAFVHVYMYASA